MDKAEQVEERAPRAQPSGGDGHAPGALRRPGPGVENRLGAVLKMPPLYRRFYLGAGLVGFSLIAYVVFVSMAADPASAPQLHSDVAQAVWLLVYHLPLAAGLTVGLVTAWRYWSWLLRES